MNYYCPECDVVYLPNEVIYVARRGALPTCPECGHQVERVEEDDGNRNKENVLGH